MTRKVFQMRLDDETEAAILMIASVDNVSKTEAVKKAVFGRVAAIVAKQVMEGRRA